MTITRTPIPDKQVMKVQGCVAIRYSQGPSYGLWHITVNRERLGLFNPRQLVQLPFLTDFGRQSNLEILLDTLTAREKIEQIYPAESLDLY